MPWTRKSRSPPDGGPLFDFPAPQASQLTSDLSSAVASLQSSRESEEEARRMLAAARITVEAEQHAAKDMTAQVRPLRITPPSGVHHTPVGCPSPILLGVIGLQADLSDLNPLLVLCSASLLGPRGTSLLQPSSLLGWRKSMGRRW